jgi:8-oxo-dGTP pyrophosphatase MutT (NUDIX family)
MTQHAFETQSPMPNAPPRTGRAARPRDAATLVIIRRDGPQLRVLMGRRHGGHNFMPGRWVFPGGRIDPADFRAPSATELRPEVAARLGKTAPARRARAVALTAIRETFEEAGLLLARPGASRPAAGPWRDFLAHDALPDLSALDFIARAITPPSVPKRFNARFFMADAERLISLERQPDCGELSEIAWLDLKEAMSLDVPAVTRTVLAEVPRRLADPLKPAPDIKTWPGARTTGDL